MPKTEEEKDQLRDLINGDPNRDDRYWFIGLWQAEANTFYWTDGEPLSYTTGWGNGQP